VVKANGMIGDKVVYKYDYTVSMKNKDNKLMIDEIKLNEFYQKKIQSKVKRKTKRKKKKRKKILLTLCKNSACGDCLQISAHKEFCMKIYAELFC